MVNMIFVLVGILLFFGLCAAAIGAARRTIKDEGRLRLREAIELARRVFSVPTQRQGATATAFAVRRCVACPDSVRCDLRLDEGDWQQLRSFCPNAGYIEALPRS